MAIHRFQTFPTRAHLKMAICIQKSGDNMIQIIKSDIERIKMVARTFHEEMA